MIIPVGAILAGLAAGSGYAVATRPQGVKMTAEMCIAIVILQLACYATARYLDYRAVDPVYEDGTPVGSLAYFDFVTRSFHWESEYGDKPGEALGAWGYGVRLLEITGFTFGGLIGALIVRKMAYCERCQRYMKTRRLPDSQPRCRPGRSRRTTPTRSRPTGASSRPPIRRSARPPRPWPSWLRGATTRDSNACWRRQPPRPGAQRSFLPESSWRWSPAVSAATVSSRPAGRNGARTGLSAPSWADGIFRPSSSRRFYRRDRGQIPTRCHRSATLPDRQAAYHAMAPAQSAGVPTRSNEIRCQRGQQALAVGGSAARRPPPGRRANRSPSRAPEQQTGRAWPPGRAPRA